MKLAYKVGDMMSVCDMHYGTHFQDGGGRKMIKLQDVLPSGLKCRWENFISGVCSDKVYTEQPSGRNYINAVDYLGIACTCPDFVKFKVIKLPNFGRC